MKSKPQNNQIKHKGLIRCCNGVFIFFMILLQILFLLNTFNLKEIPECLLCRVLVGFSCTVSETGCRRCYSPCLCNRAPGSKTQRGLAGQDRTRQCKLNIIGDGGHNGALTSDLSSSWGFQLGQVNTSMLPVSREGDTGAH